MVQTANCSSTLGAESSKGASFYAIVEKISLRR